jgi:hypothetical protein
MKNRKLISGGLAEWSNAPVLKTGRDADTSFIRPNRMPATKFATGVEALTSTPVFNHTAEAMRPKQPRLYASAVFNPREENTPWKREKLKGLK